jgi:hypothetical protein
MKPSTGAKQSRLLVITKRKPASRPDRMLLQSFVGIVKMAAFENRSGSFSLLSLEKVQRFKVLGSRFGTWRYALGATLSDSRFAPRATTGQVDPHKQGSEIITFRIPHSELRIRKGSWQTINAW